jgi:hypothetical protein
MVSLVQTPPQRREQILADIKSWYNGYREHSETALNKLLSAAFAQIEEKRYPERYKTGNKKIRALAIACSGKEIKCEIKEIV